MIVSWNWLEQYVTLDMPPAELEQRLMMTGLNHEGSEEIGGDLAVDLEVTSNRPDCLGHIGVAREVAVIWGQELKIPAAQPQSTQPQSTQPQSTQPQSTQPQSTQPQSTCPGVADLLEVRIDCPDLCFRYTARIIRGIKIGPSPKWMSSRLQTLGIAPVNNIVDISNYVLMECGQPLHAFDFAKLQGGRIIVREPLAGETIEAIDHKKYRLGKGMCVIADEKDAVAIGGVMGGAATEISDSTTDILIEAAEFEPLAIRGAARGLNLHSDSSYRFERRIDSENIDWASRRCCQLILELAGGELCQGVVDVGPARPRRQPITLRFQQVPRILGIDVPPAEVRKILCDLGNVEAKCDKKQVEVIPPSWRRDLTREIDLIEEVARIHGYEKIPQDVGVAMVSSARRGEDRVLSKTRGVLTALGYDEALTLSVVDEQTAATFSPWTDAQPLTSNTPILRGADRLRLSLVPSLLAARRINESLSNARIELFEIANVYLPRGKKLPREERMLGITSGRGFAQVKGTVESILAVLNPAVRLEAVATTVDLLDTSKSCQLRLAGNVIGYLGELLPQALKRFELRQPATVAEIRVADLLHAAELIPQFEPLAAYPAMSRDLNLVVDDSVHWADIAATVRANCEQYYESLEYRDTYRDARRLGEGKKSLLMSLTLRWREGTMTNQEADRIRDKIVAACKEKHAAELRA